MNGQLGFNPRPSGRFAQASYLSSRGKELAALYLAENLVAFEEGVLQNINKIRLEAILQGYAPSAPQGSGKATRLLRE